MPRKRKAAAVDYFVDGNRREKLSTNFFPNSRFANAFDTMKPNFPLGRSEPNARSKIARGDRSLMAVIQRSM